MTTSELKLLILNLLNQPVAFKHLIALCVIAWAYKKIRGGTANREHRNSREAINRATYNPKQFRSRSKQERDW